jgi:tetratricopeptide (TPR) repeat protein
MAAHLRRYAWCCAALALWAAAARGQAQSAIGAQFLEIGIRQVNEGDFENAVFSLETAIRRLPPGSTDELSRAHLHLGAAHVGAGHEDLAKEPFRRALALTPRVTLRDDEFPPRVIRAFEAERVRLTAQQTRSSRRKFIIGGALVGTGGAVALAAKERGTSKPQIARRR